jgi:hypothetical protein
MTLQFPITSDTSKKIWCAFERELMHKLKPLPENERDDIKMEILSHLYESASNDQADSEESRLINAIDRLGEPDLYLTPLILDILQAQSVAKGHPKAIAKSLLETTQRSLLHLSCTALFGFGYFISIMIFIMGIMHIFIPDVGIWLDNDGRLLSLSFSFQPNATQWMPAQFSFIAITVSAFSYWGLSKLLYVLFIKPKKHSKK